MQEAQMIVTRINSGEYTPSLALLAELRQWISQARQEMETHPQRRELRLELLGRLLLAANTVERKMSGGGGLCSVSSISLATNQSWSSKTAS